MSSPPRYSVKPLTSSTRQSYEMLLEQLCLGTDRPQSEPVLESKLAPNNIPLGCICYEDEHPCGLFVARAVSDISSNQQQLQLDVLFVLDGVTSQAEAVQQLLGQAYQTAEQQACSSLHWVLPEREKSLIAICDKIQAERQSLYRYEVEIKP